MSQSSSFLINGRFEGGISPLDRGLAYGDGVFRTLQHHGYPYCWDMHYHRLEADCNALGIVCPSADTLLDDIERLTELEESSVIKIIVTRGESLRSYAVPPLAQPTRIVIRTAMPQYSESYFHEGVALHLCETRLARQPKLAGIKHLNRLENVLARMEWTDRQPTEYQIVDGLMLDEEGDVIECTSANLFARFGKRIVTPDLSACGVVGVTRERLMQLVPKLGFSVEVKHLPLSELMDADEVLICNSLFGAWQVRHLSSHSWEAGTLAARLRELLREQDAISA
ncbi:MAG TPA: aminodeoxychorismate lyase [Methylophilaceae bacterium]|jgi:4-amino-4-deoxychorismate lyase